MQKPLSCYLNLFKVVSRYPYNYAASIAPHSLWIHRRYLSLFKYLYISTIKHFCQRFYRKIICHFYT